ncbi:copper transporting ATPase [Spiroplasma turonicum]|uniref:Copper transporting ATPase n=1 Tax=Spiroplasma turonicum TaxID=216946 RepID=A0A0K1P6Q1_9MOLU|nr:copper transporting ATPase [Spiroplasma turonicum]
MANNLYPDLVDFGIFVILFVKSGDYITNKIKGFVSKDLKRITSLIPTRVIKISNNLEDYVNINIVNVNNVIKIKSNEIIPLDGILLNYKANVNTQIIDGENISKTFFKNDFIFSGMKCKSDSLLLLVKNKNTDSFINKVITKILTIQS